MDKLKLHKNLKPFLDCKDFSVSNEPFSLKRNDEYDLLVTQPIPKNLGSYYESSNYISHTDSKKSIIDKLYQVVKKYTLKKKLKLINSFQHEEKSILDIGAGTGDFLNLCKQNNWTVTGVEPNLKARQIAATKSVNLFEELSQISNQQFSIITLWHVLEHVEDLEDCIHSLKKLLKEDGILIVAVPNFKSFDAKYYQKYWAAYDVPRHLWHFSKKAITKLFSTENISLLQIRPMLFDSFYVALLSEKYKTGKSNFVKAFGIGFWSNCKAFFSKEYSSLIYILKNNKN